MKTFKTLLTATFLTTLSAQVQAQDWGTTTTPTYTSSNVGIGAGVTAAPSDARLHLYNQWGSNNGYPCTGLPTSYPTLPVVLIDDNRLSSMTSVMGVPDNHNIFQINENSYLCNFLAMPTVNTVFFVNSGVGGTFVGINKATASSTLDVGGDINTDGSLIVAKNATIGQLLTVNGGVINFNFPTDSWRNFNANSSKTGLTISAGTNGAAIGGAYTQYHAFNESDPGALTIATGDNGSGTTFYGYHFDGTTPSAWSAVMNVKPNGQVAIGNDIITSGNLPSPTQYNLYVSKGILTEKVKVANSTDGINWSDFVFNKEYKLNTLNEVENYIDANKHLPEIPSASEISCNGIDIAEMDAKLLQKIEELTLYAIQQQKKIEEQDKKIDMLLKKMNN